MRAACAPSPRRGEGWGEGNRNDSDIVTPSPGALRTPTSPHRGEVKRASGASQGKAQAMEQAFGLYTHIRSNQRRSVALLIGLFLLVYVMVYAGALVAEGLTGDAPIDYLLQAALRDFVVALPWATLGTIAWIFIAYHFHQHMIDAMTGGYEVPRAEEPRLWNILENLCISRGLTMPKLKMMDSDALNAFASGLNQKQYSITVTRGLLEQLEDPEIEAVLGHELTHIRNGDVRLLVIAVVIAGVIAFFVELIVRMFFQAGLYWRGRRRESESRGGGGAAVAIVIALALIAVAWLLSVMIRFALSRSREFLADAGSRSKAAAISSGRIPPSWKCASTIRARISPICSTPIRRSKNGSRPWCATRADTIRGRSPCRRPRRKRAKRPARPVSRNPAARGAGAKSRSCRSDRRSSSAASRAGPAPGARASPAATAAPGARTGGDQFAAEHRARFTASMLRAAGVGQSSCTHSRLASVDARRPPPSRGRWERIARSLRTDLARSRITPPPRSAWRSPANIARRSRG